MRFAYIDSNGNEIPIPSIDALALRIELGAIDENTELYDAQADQWGPAHTHEIYHTLSRAAGEGGQGFVAPLPPVAPPPSVTADSEREEEEVPQADEPEELTLAEVAVEEVVDEPPSAELPDLDLELAPSVSEDLSSEKGDEISVVDPPAEATSPAEPSGFDFGDTGGGLELEQEFSAPEDGDDEPAMDFSIGANAGGDFGGGLEQAMDFSSGDGEDAGGALDLEKPMSEFTPEAPPAWMDTRDDDTGDGDAMDFSDVADTEDVSGDISPRGRRPPRTKPSAPKHRRQRSLVAPIVGVVVLLAIGMGAKVAWPILSARLAERGAPTEPVVVMPTIPAELLPQMRSIAGSAFASVFQDARSAGGEITTPSRGGLSGAYLASAGEFGNVETFWSGVGTVLGAVRGIDGPMFHAEYERSMGAAGVSPQDRALMLERADSGFVAANGAREETYALVDELIDAALALHAFLVANEENIQYAPASSGTGNPILEANASTPQIGQAMEDGIHRLTEALDALDYLDLVTADGLWAAVLTRIQEVGIR